MPQSFAQIYLHLVFSTKNRQSFFQDTVFAKELYAYLSGICKKQDCFAKIIGGYVDHIHLLCSLSRQKTVADLVRELKTSSTVWIKTQKPEWEHFHWQDGYGVFSVSHSQLEKVKEYIANQNEHHRTTTFQDELRQLLQKHGVEFDEKYIWN
jgi:REP element-mobilizing transposase RayT